MLKIYNLNCLYCFIENDILYTEILSNLDKYTCINCSEFRQVKTNDLIMNYDKFFHINCRCSLFPIIVNYNLINENYMNKLFINNLPDYLLERTKKIYKKIGKVLKFINDKVYINISEDVLKMNSIENIIVDKICQHERIKAINVENKYLIDYILYKEKFFSENQDLYEYINNAVENVF